MGDRGLGDWREIFFVGERDEVIDKVFDRLGWRWHEYCRAWVVGTATYPVLLLTDRAAVLIEAGPNEEETVNL